EKDRDEEEAPEIGEIRLLTVSPRPGIPAGEPGDESPIESILAANDQAQKAGFRQGLVQGSAYNHLRCGRTHLFLQEVIELSTPAEFLVLKVRQRDFSRVGLGQFLCLFSVDSDVLQIFLPVWFGKRVPALPDVFPCPRRKIT